MSRSPSPPPVGARHPAGDPSATDPQAWHRERAAREEADLPSGPRPLDPEPPPPAEPPASGAHFHGRFGEPRSPESLRHPGGEAEDPPDEG